MARGWGVAGWAGAKGGAGAGLGWALLGDPVSWTPLPPCPALRTPDKSKHWTSQLVAADTHLQLQATRLDAGHIAVGTHPRPNQMCVASWTAGVSLADRSPGTFRPHPPIHLVSVENEA